MRNVVFYGGGSISQAIIEGLIGSGFNKKNIFYVDRNSTNKKKLKKLKIRSFKKNNNTKVDLFILAVKPKDAIDAYKKILDQHKNPKVISLVAGIRSNKYINFNKKIEFLRAMPNTSSKHGLGITAVFNSSFTKNNLKKVVIFLNKVGIVITVDKESKIDTFTGIIGSGPAYFFHLLKSYERKLLSISNGDKKMVNKVMSNLMKGVGMSIEKNTNLDNLITAVASKKGTTEAGLKSFKSHKLGNIFEKGLNAAIKRSKEISNEY